MFPKLHIVIFRPHHSYKQSEIVFCPCSKCCIVVVRFQSKPLNIHFVVRRRLSTCHTGMQSGEYPTWTSRFVRTLSESFWTCLLDFGTNLARIGNATVLFRTQLGLPKGCHAWCLEWQSATALTYWIFCSKRFGFFVKSLFFK